MGKPKLTAELVQKIFNECKTEENKNSIFVSGSKTGKIKFDPIILNKRKNIISLLISQLRDVNKKLSFLNLFITNKDIFWTGFRNDMEKLVLLGIAIGKLEYYLPTYETPKHIPYYVVAKNIQNHK